MSKKIYSSIGTKHKANLAPQSQPVKGREREMIKNDAGGWSFKISPLKALERFLILGSEQGSYYVGKTDMTKRSYNSLIECLKVNPVEAIDMIVEISDSGRAPKNDPAIFALAVCASSKDIKARQYALDHLGKVCRTGTHLFDFCQYLTTFRGWGRAVRKAIAKWYLDRSPLSLSTQLAKYQSRNGWSHKDVIRLAHVDSSKADYAKQNLLAWSVDKEFNEEKLIGLVECHKYMQSATSVYDVVSLINEYLAPRELVPTQYLKDPMVWRAMLPSMGAEALVRNLGNMTSYGVFQDTESLLLVIERLGDPDWIKSNRLHPIKSLIAKLQYGSGAGDKGNNSWTPVRKIVDALERSFYLGFKAVVPTNKKICYALDVSGSMSYGGVPGIPSMTCSMGAAAMALVCASTEPNYYVGGFSTKFVNLNVKKGMTIEEAMRNTSDMTFGGTDASVPFHWAIENNKDFDAFVCITDNESWAGGYNRGHPYQALDVYRQKVGHKVNLITMAITATSSSITDQTDEDALDVVGFDTSVPELISNFIR